MFASSTASEFLRIGQFVFVQGPGVLRRRDGRVAELPAAGWLSVFYDDEAFVHVLPASRVL